MSRVEIPSENQLGPLPAVLFGDPAVTKKGVVVVQEWWGMNQQIQDEAKQISEEGSFVTIVPDLYRGKVATDNEEAGHLMGNLNWSGAVKDIAACARFLKEKGCSKVGVTGFCMGGALSFAAAALVPEVDAAAPFYGIPSSDLCDVSTIKIPLQCHFGDQDQVAGFSDPAAQEILKEKLVNVKHEFFVYPAGHAFTNAVGFSDPTAQKALKEKLAKVKHEFYVYHAAHAFTNRVSPNFNEAACKLSFERMYQFFKSNL